MKKRTMTAAAVVLTGCSLSNIAGTAQIGGLPATTFFSGQGNQWTFTLDQGALDCVGSYTLPLTIGDGVPVAIECTNGVTGTGLFTQPRLSRSRVDFTLSNGQSGFATYGTGPI